MTRICNSKVLSLASVTALFALFASAFADVPSVISYQGRLTDDAGNPFNGTKLIKFKIYGSEAGDDSLWSSDFRVVEVNEGLFNYNLGSNVPLPENLFSDDSVRYLGITVDTDEELAPRVKFNASAYAFQSGRSDSSGFSEEIADDAVTSAKIADGAIQFSDIGENGAVDGQFIKREAGNWISSDLNYGSVFIRYGSTVAPAGTSLLYSGIVYTSAALDEGSLPPVVLSNDDTASVMSGEGGELAPAGLNNPPPGTSAGILKAAVCYAESPVFTLWGSHNPPPGWRALYRGYAVGSRHDLQGHGSIICVESENFEFYADLDGWSYFWSIKNVGGPAPGLFPDAFPNGTYVKCAVCAKE